LENKAVEVRAIVNDPVGHLREAAGLQGRQEAIGSSEILCIVSGIVQGREPPIIAVGDKELYKAGNPL